MPVHLVAYAENQAAAGTDQDVSHVPEVGWSERNSHWVPDQEMSLLAATALGADLLRVRLQNSEFRSLGAFDVYPFEAAALFPDNMRYAKYTTPYPKIKPHEELSVLTSSDAAGAQHEVIGLWVTDRNGITPIPMDRFRVRCRFTASVTATVLTWSAPANIAFTQDLKTGRWGICGFMAQANDGYFARIRVNNSNWAPGVPVTDSLDDITNLDFFGGFGLLHTFHTFEVPQIEMLGVAAGAEAIIGFMDLVYLGEQ